MPWVKARVGRWLAANEQEDEIVPDWDASTWGTVIGCAIGIVGVVVAILAWLRPGASRQEGQLQVEVSNVFPVFTQLDGSQRVGEHLVAVTLRNPTSHPVKVTWWGFELGRTGQKMYVTDPPVDWEPPVPHIVPAHDSAGWHITPAQLRQAVKDKRVRYQDFRAFVSLADGRTIKAGKSGVPLKD